MSDRFWFLKTAALFEQLGADELAWLESRARIRTFERNSLIYLSGDASDAVLLLVSGAVKLYHLTSDGKQALLAFIHPGELFGELAVFEIGQREEFAESMETSRVVMIPRADMLSLMERQPGVSLGVTKLIGLRRRRVERRLKALLFRSNRERLIHLLLELAESYGRRTPEGVMLGIKLSHQELASIIGSTRETVTLLLGELQSAQMLEIRRRQIVITNIERLADIVHLKQVPLECERIAGNLLPQGGLGT